MKSVQQTAKKPTSKTKFTKITSCPALKTPINCKLICLNIQIPWNMNDRDINI